MPLIFSLVFTFLSAGGGTASFAIQESVRSRIVAPGVRHTMYEKPGPYVIHVLEIDLREPTVQIESFRLQGLVKTTTQALANEREGSRVVAAINADFFSFQTGWPLGIQAMRGKLIHAAPTSRSHIAFDRKKRPLIEQFSFRGSISTKYGDRFQIDRVNEPRTQNRVTLYTSEWDTLLTVSPGDMVLHARLTGTQWSIGDTLRVVVLSLQSESPTQIGYHEVAILVSEAEVKSKLQKKLRLRDTLALYLGLNPYVTGVQEVVGGAGTLLRNGLYDSTAIIKSERLASNFLTTRHPRRFVGFDRDTTKLFFCTVDGRQELSIGMSFQEMADFLQSIGAWNAINLDGGGSTTMVVEGQIVNSPSDRTGERPVANTLQVISKTFTNTR
ncbi:MAG TPA: phosphodiester glycosidase family protein [Bacteroidota bacterium]|nr:phosphodiester glycosidase family protein [Bacteroidota bacterium]